MPLTSKGKKIMSSMKSQYGSKKGTQVFYASKNAGKIQKVDKGFYGHWDVCSSTPIKGGIQGEK